MVFGELGAHENVFDKGEKTIGRIIPRWRDEPDMGFAIGIDIGIILLYLVERNRGA